jgi:tetratricopeptide (TPR) repeat protein
MKLFLSCVSVEFRSYRLKLANQLGALKGRPHEVKVQEDFQQGGHTLLDSLSDYVRECDLVIHLVGDACGARPTPEHERTLLRHLGEPDSTPAPGWSYTQWEYHLARRFGKRMLVYFAATEAPRDCGPTVNQSDDAAALQQTHAQHIRDSGEHWGTFRDLHQFVREVFHDLGLEPDLKANNLPGKTLGSLFKGRDDFLAKIRTTLGEAEHLGHRRVAAITATATAASVHGLGGIGKTRAAVEFGLRHARDYTALLFVQADSPAKLDENLAALCDPLVLDLPEQATKETEVRVAAALQWLQQHPGWFLIFDNVDTEEASKAVEDLLGRLSAAGQVLITSRLSRWSGSVVPLALDVLSLDSATEFLLERTQSHRRSLPDDAVRARELAELLGQLALALEQAGAYIVTNRFTFAQYLDAWRTRHDTVLAWFDERLMQYPRSVAVTWQTSVDQLTPAARELLHRLAWFAPDPIPESLLDVTAPPLTPAFSPGGGESARREDEGEADARTALANLEAYSLATRDGTTPTFTVHRLVLDVTRCQLQRGAPVSEPAGSSRVVGSAGSETGAPALRSALQWINAAFVSDPQDVRSWPLLVPLAPHALVCGTFADTAAIPCLTIRLLNRLAILFNTQARLTEAEPLMRRALAIDEQFYGARHPRVATHLNNLAQLLQDTNRLAEAEPLMRRALAIFEHSYGAEHPRVANGLNNVALMLKDTNHLAEAEPLMRRALAIDEQSYGAKDPRVANGLNNLAQLLQDTNRLIEAELLMRRALAIDERSYGAKHPNVASDLNNLAQLLQATNRLTEAEPLMRRALAIDEQSYGTEHPDVAVGLINLAALLQDTNRLAEAEPLMLRVVEIFLKFTVSTGHPHPHLQAAFGNYAALLSKMGRSEQQVLAQLNDLARPYGIQFGGGA